MSAYTKESMYRSMKRLFKNYVRMCRRRNIYWELAIEQFQKITSQNCHYCGRVPAQKSRSYTYNGIDRVENKKGYITENVVPACRECNFIKGSTLSHDEMKVVGEALTRFRQRRS